MFGSQPRIRAPVLLILVYGVFVALVGITATAQAILVSAHFSAAVLNDVVSSDLATTRAFVNAHPHFLDPSAGGTPPADLTALQSQLATLRRPGEILRIEVRLPDGTIVASDDPTLRGNATPVTSTFALASDGTPQVAIVADGQGTEAGPGALGSTSVLREYLPLLAGGKVLAVVGIWRDAIPILDRLADVRRAVVLVTMSAGLIAAGLLFLIFRTAQVRLTLQTRALVESTRRDPLTGTLNHGALVAHLAGEIERSRVAGTSLGVALIDVDNFRLLNDNHGHRAGDDVLVSVAGLLDATFREGIVVGRYGPDEFLVVAPFDYVVHLEPGIERLRTAIADLSLKFETTERMPVTISAGICTYPQHGSAVTVLLATAVQTLEDAKASGGDAIRMAGEPIEESAAAAGFDVLQGLVIAIDVKDRYTKRHSEDVARYAVFLAERLGIDPDLIASIRLAGLLHDVGKIGIPDPILRKPGKLTAAEYEIVKQHVALGDMIVRDVPDIDVVRAGIRHHHERWDGNGYLDRLEAEEIPLIARILAVGDAFSAMTTTRPYRKALGVREALARIEDAAGSELDERLVRAFVMGIESAPNPPLPEAEGGRSLLWTAVRRVA
ncbi:MAG: diguanylate cyclase [Chloroflexota bacterium]|nr:diguanylate cyclase [Chloroflexota bacterium]